MSEFPKQLDLFNFNKTPEELAKALEQSVKESRKYEIDIEDEKLQDMELKKHLADIKAPRGFVVFSRKTKDGIHEIGVEKISRKDGDPPTILLLPGWCHGNWSWFKHIKQYAEMGIEVTAISPPGESQSRPFGHKDEESDEFIKKPIEEWVMADYVDAYEEFIVTSGKEFIVAGYSLGGLHALLLANDTRQKIKDQIIGVISINSVKPSNICRRGSNVNVLDDFPDYELNGESPLIFRPVKQKNWVYNNLFRGADNCPVEIAYIEKKFFESVGSYNPLNDYSGENGELLSANLSKPILEFSGTKDKGDSTAVYQGLKEEQTTAFFDAKKGEFKVIEQKIIREVEQLDIDLREGEITEHENEARGDELERQRKKLETEFNQWGRQIIHEKRIVLKEAVKQGFSLFHRQKRTSIALYYANEKGSDFKFQHHLLDGASHGDPIFTDEYVKQVVLLTATAIRSRFFGIYNVTNEV